MMVHQFHQTLLPPSCSFVGTCLRDGRMPPLGFDGVERSVRSHSLMRKVHAPTRCIVVEADDYWKKHDAKRAAGKWNDR